MRFQNVINFEAHECIFRYRSKLLGSRQKTTSGRFESEILAPDDSLWSQAVPRGEAVLLRNQPWHPFKAKPKAFSKNNQIF